MDHTFRMLSAVQMYDGAGGGVQYEGNTCIPVADSC